MRLNNDMKYQVENRIASIDVYDYCSNELLLGKSNMTVRLKLYIDLVSDLMFNFHMVDCLKLRTSSAEQNGSNYVYVYSHRPTFKARSLFRDHLTTFPHVIGHFAELGE
jgi:hypothetical protein